MSTFDPHRPPDTGPEWQRNGRASDVPIEPGGCPFDDLDDVPLSPNRADISRHLYALFPPAFVQPYPDAWIEIAYADLGGDGVPNAARHFSPFNLPEAIDFAEKKNKAGFNIYVGPALRHGKTGDKSNGRSSGANFLATLHQWVDFEKPGDDTRIDAILQEKNLLNAMTVVTGNTPNFRAHLYFKLAGKPTKDQVRDVNIALKKWLGTDDVEDVCRVMRLAGTVSYPPPDKVERGYVPELVKLHIRKDAPSYSPEQLLGFAGKKDLFGFDLNNAKPPGRTDDEIITLLEASRVKGAWHNNIRAAIASMIGYKWSDLQIRLACAPYCEGADDPGLDDLINRGRKKWDKPDAEAAPGAKDYGDEFGQQAKPTGIPLDFYEDFDKAVAKNWIIKGVIAKGDTSSWVGPPGSGKSALITNVVSHATEGIEWRGYRSKEKVGVVYFALERGQLVKRRLIAANGPPKLPIAVASHVINLLDPACVPVIVETIRTAEAHFGCPVGMIAIDTFNKGIAAGGGDEDKAKDQNTTFANLRRVHELVSVHIALIGHTGKDESRGARGSSAHPGDVDMMVQISVAGDTRTATITKINDGMEGVLTRFKLKPVILGQDEDGDPITTAIVDDAVNGEPLQGTGAAKGRWPKSLRIFKAALETALVDHGKLMRPYGNEGALIRAVSIDVVEKEFSLAYPAEVNTERSVRDAKRKAFGRALKQGRDEGVIGSREVGGVDYLWRVDPP